MPRRYPLVLVALAACAACPPRGLIEALRCRGAVVYTTHGPGGCLRAATTLGPSAIFLDPRLPRRLVGMLKSHPTSAAAAIHWLCQPDVQSAQAD